MRGGPELRGAARGFGVAAATGALLGKLTWRNHDTAGGAVQTVAPPSGTFLEYEGTVNPTDPVLALEHMDGASLSWKGGERVWSGRWGPWTHMTTFVKDGTDHLLTYNRPTGAVMFSRFWGSLHGVETVWQGTWGPWTHFVPFTWNGNDHLLTYDRDSRTAMISRFWPGLNGVETVWQGTWGPWTHLAVFHRDGQPFLLAYDRPSQKAMTSRFWGGLNGVETIWEGQWGPWTHLVPMSAPDRTHLVAYDAETGVLQISQFFPGLTGTHATHQETIAPGCDVAAVRAPGLPHFTVHRHQIDRRTLYRISPDGVDPVAGLPTGGGTKGASIDVPFRLDGRAYQVNYYPATQDVDFTRWRTL